MEFNDPKNVLTETKLNEMMGLVFGPVIRESAYIPHDEAYKVKHLGREYIYCGPRFKRALDWEITESKKWSGRNWRRIKRERRKWMKGAKRGNQGNLSRSTNQI